MPSAGSATVKSVTLNRLKAAVVSMCAMTWLSLAHDPRLHQPVKIPIRQAYEFRMRAGVEGDLLVFGQTLGDKHLHPVEIAKGGHRPHVACGKQVTKLPLAGELSLADTRGVLQALEIDLVGRGEHGHGQTPVQLDHDGFRY